MLQSHPFRIDDRVCGGYWLLIWAFVGATCQHAAPMPRTVRIRPGAVDQTRSRAEPPALPTSSRSAGHKSHGSDPAQHRERAACWETPLRSPIAHWVYLSST